MCDNLRILLTSYFIFIYVFLSDAYEQRDGINFLIEGSSCQPLGYPGLCTKVKDCLVAVSAIKNKNRHDLKRCGLDKKEELVCCPALSPRNPVIESTTFEGFIIPDDGGFTPSSTTNGDNLSSKERLQLKRKYEKACEKIYKSNNIRPPIDFQLLDGDAKKGQFPHVVALGFENGHGQIEWNCGASLISPRFLLTAAHCFICNGCAEPKKARMGIIDKTDEEGAQDIDVKDSTSHPEFDIITRHNDIAIVELVKDVQMSINVFPACLYTEVDDPPVLQIAGWGQTVSNDRNSKATILQFATVDPVPVNECNETVVTSNKYSSKEIVETQICATTKRDVCPGDSGGPLQIPKKEGSYEIVGIISYGSQCGSKIPGIYTRVSQYLDWIEKIVWPEEIK